MANDLTSSNSRHEIRYSTQNPKLGVCIENFHNVELRLFNVVEFKPEGSMEALPGEIGGLQDEMIDSDTKGNQEVVPLEKDKSNHIPPIITPSEEVVKATTSSQHMGSVLNAAHGKYKPLLPP